MLTTNEKIILTTNTITLDDLHRKLNTEGDSITYTDLEQILVRYSDDGVLEMDNGNITIDAIKSRNLIKDDDIENRVSKAPSGDDDLPKVDGEDKDYGDEDEKEEDEDKDEPQDVQPREGKPKKDIDSKNTELGEMSNEDEPTIDDAVIKATDEEEPKDLADVE